MSPKFTIEIYNQEAKEEWNEFVRNSKNGTFLFDRNYMDYHSNRFEDMSLVVRNSKGKVAALLPGNRCGSTYYSHQGLTYGGLIMDNDMTATNCLTIFDIIAEFLKSKNIDKIVYKATPHIYHKYPAGEDLYALYRKNVRLISRTISTIVLLNAPIELSTMRRRRLRKAENSNLTFCEKADMKEYIRMVDENLRLRHGVGCVHTPDEMQLLKDRFPDNIRLFTANKDNKLLAGALLYITNNTVHTQYLCANEEGRKLSALDFVIARVKDMFGATHTYLDFGHSTEMSGHYLNEGLISQKEGFGGRGVCCDTYEWNLPKLIDVEFRAFDERFLNLSTKWLTDPYIISRIDAPEYNRDSQLEWFRSITERPDEKIVRGIEADGKAIGAMGLKVCVDAGSRTAEYWGYIGEPEFRGKGIGKEMLRKANELAHDADLKSLWLKVLKTNSRAIALYLNHGFSILRSDDKFIYMTQKID